MVVRQERRGVWCVSATKTLTSFTQALEVRLQELQKLELPDNAFLPKAGQVRAQKELQERWYRTELGQKILAEVNRLPSSSCNRRSVDSYYRRAQYTDYGGREWCNILLAIGDVDELIVSLMAELVAERRALATTQGSSSRSESARVPRTQRPGPSCGVQHQESEAKKARNHAKSLDKKLATQKAWWEEGRLDKCLPWHAWQKLQAERDAAWDHAEGLSWGSGFPFFDRHGHRQQEDPKDLVGLALRRWCQARGVRYA
jgi:hypothetical protein